MVRLTEIPEVYHPTGLVLQIKPEKTFVSLFGARVLELGGSYSRSEKRGHDNRQVKLPFKVETLELASEILEALSGRILIGGAHPFTCLRNTVEEAVLGYVAMYRRAVERSAKVSRDEFAEIKEAHQRAEGIRVELDTLLMGRTPLEDLIQAARLIRRYGTERVLDPTNLERSVWVVDPKTSALLLMLIADLYLPNEGPVTIELIGALQKRTGLSERDCRPALEDARGNGEKAEADLRERGLCGPPPEEGKAFITIAQVKRLRELTGAGMMACKRALVKRKGDLEAAKEYLDTRGLC